MFDTSLLEDSVDSVTNKLKSFNDLNCLVSTFDNVDISDRETLVQLIEKHAGEENASFATASLNTLRLLSRDGKNIELLYNNHVAEYILGWARLYSTTEDRLEGNNLSVRMEALKCLINGLYHSNNLRQYFSNNSHAALKSYLVDLSQKQKEEQLSPTYNDLQTYILRILFITTALQENFRELWLKDDYHQILMTIIKQRLSEDHLNEVMKILFNLLCSQKNDVHNDERDTPLLAVLYRILTVSPSNNVIQNAVNLLAVLPVKPDVLCPDMDKENRDAISDKTYDGMDMVPIQMVIDEMDRKMGNKDIECIGTFLTVLIKYSVACKEARRYIRLQILPPLREIDVTRPPSDGDTLRNKLVRLMMTMDRSSTLASELMFVLCKRSVGRMIKYTGLGHSAGLFANSGLLGQINTPRSEENSEDSDTEEYNAVEPQVNPVTGYIRPQDGVSPFEGMSEEQKEFEAMKLVELMNKMMDDGMFKPGTIGEDGKPRAVSHVLELTKDVPDTKNNDTDSE